MSEPDPSAQGQHALGELLREAGALLRYQRELGLVGLNVDEELLVRRRRAPTSAALAPPHAATQQVAPPHTATQQVAPPHVAAQPSAPGPNLTDVPAPEALRLIREDIGDCQRCKLSGGRTTIVFGVGNPQARLMFVGEGPGRDEDLQGEPFVGKAGHLLDRMIVAMGLRREQTYISNIVKCRPPRNRDPEPDEVAACEPFLKRQIQVVKPEVLVALGRCAAQTLLRTTTPISRLRGTWQTYEGIPLMPTFHPAYLLRNPAEKRAAWQDLQQVMARLGLKDPRRD